MPLQLNYSKLSATSAPTRGAGGWQSSLLSYCSLSRSLGMLILLFNTPVAPFKYHVLMRSLLQGVSPTLPDIATSLEMIRWRDRSESYLTDFFRGPPEMGKPELDPSANWDHLPRL